VLESFKYANTSLLIKCFIVCTRKLFAGVHLFCYYSFTKYTFHREITVWQIRFYIKKCQLRTVP